MQSSRLPGKVLMDINGAPALTRLLRRLRQCQRLDDIVVATTVDTADGAIEAWAAAEGVAYHRGSEDDVLQRVADAHRNMGSDIIVEVTGDSILTDPAIIDLGIETFLGNRCDVVTNAFPETFPMGVNVQVFRAPDLVWVAKNIQEPAVREHVSLYFYEHPERYRIIRLFAPAPWRGGHLRWQLDYPEDLEFLNRVYAALEPRYGDTFGLTQVMELLRERPQLADINAHCVEKSVR